MLDVLAQMLETALPNRESPTWYTWAWVVAIAIALLAAAILLSW